MAAHLGLIVQTAFLGDVVLTTPLIRAIRAKFPGAEIDFVTTPVGAEALKGLQGVNPLALDKKKLSFLESLSWARDAFRGKKYDVVYCVHRSPRSLAIARLAKTRKPIAFASPAARVLGFKTVPYPQYEEGVHYADKVLKLADANVSSKPFLGVLEQDELRRADLLEPFGEAPYLVVSPFSVWGTKQWFPDRFAAAAAKFSMRHGCAVVVVGSGTPAEAKIGEAIAQQINDGGGRALSLVNQTSVGEVKALIAKAAALLSNDSAPVHIAAAFNVPTVAIFGPTVQKLGFYPLSDRAKVVERTEVSCRPCSLHGPQKCPLTHFQCMDKIQSADVLEGLESVWPNRG